jgi:serine protease Do
MADTRSRRPTGIRQMKGPSAFVLAGLVLAAAFAPHAFGAKKATDFRKVIREATDRVFPAVVFVKCVRESYEGGKKTSQEVSGSGVLISPRGELLTNWHVVDNAIQLRCLLYDGKAYEAKVLGTDKDTDLALLQLDFPKDAKDLPFAKLGDSKRLKEGDFVMAMGAPWGLSRSVSSGIVACTRRFLEKHSEYSLWLQTDASISPGNSGGPLVNTSGEVIGINTRGSSGGGGDLGFAVPSNTIKVIASQLRDYGAVQWSWTGLQLQPIRDFNRDIYFDATDGVIVAGTDPESPAQKAGIKVRDRITKIDNVDVTGLTQEDLPALRRLLGLLTKGKAINVELVRAGKSMTVTMTPRMKGKVEGDELDCPRWDFTVRTINQFDNRGLYFYRKKGVFVFGIKSPGNAQKSGLQPKDILMKIGDAEVRSLDEVTKIHAEAIKNVGKTHKVLLHVLRGGVMKFMVLDYSRDHEKE